MESVILPIFRRTLLSGACVLLLAGCGGGDDNAEAPSPQAAAPADSAGPASSAPATPQPAPATPAAPGTAAPNAGQKIAVPDSGRVAEILKAPVTGPVNAQVLENYQLSMDGLRKLVRAGQNLAELQARRPDLRDSMRLEAFDPNAIHEKLNSIPDVREAIGRAGMTPREYATATAALMQAAMVRQMRAQGLSPQVEVNEANVTFVNEHWDEIQQLMRSAAEQMRPRS